MNFIYTLTSSRMRALLVAGLVWIPSIGCAVHTAAPVATVHQTALVGWDSAAFSDQAYDPRWWQQLDDAVLEQLETAALGANHDVRSAVARLDAARAVFDEDRRSQYPKVTAGAAVDVRDQAIPGFFDQPLRVDTYSAGFNASWELDLFGRVRAAVAAASGNAESFEAALAAVRVSVAEVARTISRCGAFSGGCRCSIGADQSARETAVDHRAPRCRHRRAGCRQASARVSAIKRSCLRCARRSRLVRTGLRC